MRNKTNPKETKCPRCNYSWATKSEFFYVTCPKCLRKVEVENKQVPSGPAPSV